MFTREIYVERRRRLCERCGDGLLLLPGHVDSPVNYPDNCYRFRQDSTFLYYFGLDQPGLAAVVDADSGETTLFGDDQDVEAIVWTGPLPTLADRGAAAGVTRVRPLAALAEALAGREVHYLPPYRAETLLRLAELLLRPPAALRAGASPRFVHAVIAQRAFKGPEEIAEIEAAVAISVAMHEAAMSMVRPGMSEAEVAAEVERIALAAGGRVAYPVIATVRGEVLHNHDHKGTLAAADLFLLDAGAETARGYAADLSSTFPVAPRFRGRQRTLYELQLAAQAAAVAALAPGVPFVDVHFAAARVICDGMKDLGLLRGDTDEALAAGAHAIVFPCGVGHMLGLDVHDMEDLGEDLVGWEGRDRSTQFGLKSLRLGRKLQPGFTVTIEPGIYFIPELIELWRANHHNAAYVDFAELEKWRDCGGVRNEEDFLITGDGARRLGPSKPLTVADVEALRA